jgi:hypothetical protein
VAEKEEKASEVDLPEAEGDTPKILGLPKPLFLKVAIGLVVLILAGAGAFFLMGDEAVPAEEAVEMIDEDKLVSTPDDNAESEDDKIVDAETAEKMMALREQSVIIKEENVQLREYILELQAEINRINGQLANPANTQRKPNAAFLNNYGNDANAFPPIETEQPKPRPKPRWGEFKRPVR